MHASPFRAVPSSMHEGYQTEGALPACTGDGFRRTARNSQPSFTNRQAARGRGGAGEACDSAGCWSWRLALDSSLNFAWPVHRRQSPTTRPPAARLCAIHNAVLDPQTRRGPLQRQSRRSRREGNVGQGDGLTTTWAAQSALHLDTPSPAHRQQQPSSPWPPTAP